MYPPIFATCAANATVQARLGASPCRLYPAGEAPIGVTTPYAVWTSIGGLPENNLSTTPDIDQWSLQVDVYADDLTDARNAAEALRDAIEPNAHITSWSGESRDPETRRYRFSFDVDWYVNR